MLPQRLGASQLLAFAWMIWMGVACGAQSAIPAAAQALPPMVLADLGRASLPIETWRFHPGDDMAWAAPGFDDSGWAQIHAGRSWEGQGYRGMTGFGWYRRRIEVAAGAPTNWDMALYLDKVDSACEIYWNGVKVGEVGRVPPRAVWYYIGDPHTIRLGSAASGVLAIRVWRAPRFFLSSPEEGGLEAVPVVGNAEALEGKVAAGQLYWLRNSVWDLAVALVSAVVGILAFLGWLRNRPRRMLLWLALASIFPASLEFALKLPGLMSFRWFYAVIGEDVLLHDIAVWFLLIALLGLKDHPWLARWSRGLAIAGVPLVLVDTVLMTLEWAPARVRTFLVLDIVTTIPLVFLEGWGIVIVWVGLRRRLDRSRLFLAISALLVELVQLLQNMDLGARWTHWDTSNWTAAAVVRVAGSPLTVTALLNLTFLIAILYSAWRYIAEADARQRALEQEYHSAQELQQVLVPEAIPALTGCTVASVYRPAQEVGGDFFQVIPQEGGGVVVIIGDVSGHGLHAAMTVALIVGAIRSTVETTQEPAEILTALNRRLHGRLHGGFATCLAARVDAGGNCMIANAGHLPPFLNGKEVELEPALPLGIAAEAEYRSAKLKLEAGSRLTLYTDGVLEARNAEGELFGFERVREWSARRAEEIAAEAQRFGQEDDITVLTLEPVPVEVAHA